MAASHLPVHATGLAFCTTLLLAWGALAFGGVYPWAYWPLFLCATTLGLWGSVVPFGRQAPFRLVDATVVSGCAAIIAAVLLQLIPLPVATLESLSPATTGLLRDYAPAFTAGLIGHHPISIDARSSWIGLAALASLIALFLGQTRLLHVYGTRRLTTGISILGAVMALIALVQSSVYEGKIYGFWTPEATGIPYGSFVNRNHFAGWMLMALPLTIAAACATIERGAGAIKPGFRNRLLWLGSQEASYITLLGSAAALMALSVLLSLSRSGIACFAISVGLLAVVALRRGKSGRNVVLAYLLIVSAIAASWARLGPLLVRFEASDIGRLGAWKDALDIAQRFLPFGSGFNTYGITTLFYQTYGKSLHYAQAHNDYLQLLAEGGLLLAIPALAFLIAYSAAIRRRFAEAQDDTMTWWLRVGAVVGLVAVSLQEIVDFSLQMPGNAALFAVVAAMAVHRPPPRRRPGLSPIVGEPPIVLSAFEPRGLPAIPNDGRVVRLTPRVFHDK